MIIYILSNENRQSLVADDDWDHFCATVKSAWNVDVSDKKPDIWKPGCYSSEGRIETYTCENVFYVTCVALNHDAGVLTPGQLLDKFKQAFCTATGIEQGRTTVKVEIDYS